MKSLKYSIYTFGLILAVIPSAARAARQPSPQELYQELTQARYVVKGTVVQVADLPGKPGIRVPISEHSPIWKQATIEVEQVAKGSPAGTLQVRFNDSSDVSNWSGPKPKVGDDAVYLILADQLRQVDGEILNALDVQPAQDFDQIVDLINHPPQP